MLHRTLLALALFALLVPSMASAQGVPTLTLGSSAAINVIPPGEIVADGKKITLSVLVTDANGGLANGAKFRGSNATKGRLDAECQQVGPGLYNCGYTTDQGSGGTVEFRLRAKLPSGAELKTAYSAQLVRKARARIAMNASPDRIVLTQDPSSALTFNVTDSQGRSIDGLTLGAIANVGSVSSITGGGSGSYTATYTPPSTPFPQVAIVSVFDANDPQRSFGFFRIPLVGKVDYPVDARAPGVQLSFKVGDRTFPPVTTDATGKAVVPIEVPPGVPSASVELKQANGSVSQQTIDLQVPPFSRLGIGGAPAFLPADGQATALVRVFVVDPRGRPADGQNVKLTASEGRISAAKFVGNGIYEAQYQAPKLQGASRATISAVLVGQEQVSNGLVEIGLEPVGPEALKLTANPAQITPNDSKSTLTASLLGAGGQPAQGTYSVEFRTAEGPVRNPKVVSPGVFSVDLPVTWNVRTVAQAIAGIRGNRQAVEHIVALPLEDHVLTGQKIPISVVTLDKYGNPVADVPVNASIGMGGGSVTSSVQTDSRGIGAVLFSAGSLPGMATVTFSVGDVTYTAPLYQSEGPVEKFEFPTSGGQTQGRMLAKWKKLRSRVVLGATQQVAVSTPPAGANPWGGAPAGNTNATGTDTGSAQAASTAAAINVSVVPGTVPTTGGTVNVLVRVVDGSGLLVPGENVILLSDAGTLSNKVDNGDGTFTAILSVPANTGKSSIQVTATRPAGDLAGFTTITVGGDAVAAQPQPQPQAQPKPQKQPKPKKPASDDDAARKAHRRVNVLVQWAPGAYVYDSKPCVGDDGCTEPPEADLLAYDFLKAETRAPLTGSFGVRAEAFPALDLGGFASLGVGVHYANLGYQTDFPLSGGDGSGGHCANNFCDRMNFLNADFLARFTIPGVKGPLEPRIRLGYAAQDVVVFRRVLNTESGEREALFQTITAHGLRFGVGVDYTVIPQVRPHVEYAITGGIQGYLDGSAFPLTGVTNHAIIAGVSAFPIGPLMVDFSYDLNIRSLSLAAFNEDGVQQRGRTNEQSHTFRLGAGVAF